MNKSKWRSFSTNINQAVASVDVDIVAKVIAPFERRPCLLWVWVSLQVARSDGLATLPETPTLANIEQTLIKAFSSSLQAQFVGRITTQGRREFYYYAPSKFGFEAAIGDATARHPAYRFNWGTQDDPEWSHYDDVLHPNLVQMDEIENARLIGILAKNGDALTIARPIEHYAFFSDLDQADSFAGEVVKRGYSLVDVTQRAGELRNYGVKFQRVEIPELAGITHSMQELRRLAADRGGEYDGWETSIILF